MTTARLPAAPGRRWVTTPASVWLLLTAAVAWTALQQLRTGDMQSFGGFAAPWALMMTAMMLPAVAPVAALYARTVPAGRRGRLAGFAAGYLLVWAATAVPAYAVWLAIDRGVTPHPVAVRVVGASIFAACGLYQLTPLKQRCLRHCRSPVAQLMRYASFGGRARDLRVGLHHAAYCLGCCWALMLLLFAFGAMSLAAAAGLTVAVVAEKMSPWGQPLSRAFGLLALGWAVVVAVHPAAAPGLQPMMPALPSMPMPS